MTATVLFLLFEMFPGTKWEHFYMFCQNSTEQNIFFWCQTFCSDPDIMPRLDVTSCNFTSVTTQKQSSFIETQHSVIIRMVNHGITSGCMLSVKHKVLLFRYSPCCASDTYLIYLIIYKQLLLRRFINLMHFSYFNN